MKSQELQDICDALGCGRVEDDGIRFAKCYSIMPWHGHWRASHSVTRFDTPQEAHASLLAYAQDHQRKATEIVAALTPENCKPEVNP